MRLMLCLLLAFPVYAQAPNTREIQYKCDEAMQLCVVGAADWAWMVKSMKAKDEEIARLNRGCGPWRFD